jgi:electron transfer flavoprotein beta subunit
MDIVVCVKYAPDVSEIRVDKKTRVPILTGVPYKISDFDRNALEEAIRIKEKHGGSVSVISLGNEEIEEGLREALAMGADRAYAIISEGKDTLVDSLILAKAIERVGYDLIICGEASIDSYSAQMPPRIAERLGILQLTYVNRISIDGDGVIVERDMEEGIEEVEAKMPCLLSVIKTINEPRLPTLMQILEASEKEIVEWSITDLDIKHAEIEEKGISIMENVVPVSERKGMIFEAKDAVESLARELIKEGILG